MKLYIKRAACILGIKLYVQQSLMFSDEVLTFILLMLTPLHVQRNTNIPFFLLLL